VPALRAIVAAAPDYAPTHGLLARAVSSNLCSGKRMQPGGDPEEGRREAERALQLDPDNVDAHLALAYMACRDLLWQACFKQTRVALALDPTDAQTRIQYAWWLVGAGYLHAAQLETEAAWFSDPLNYWINFARGRVLDTLGRHDEARRFFDAMPALDAAGAKRLVYPRWFNAVWRADIGAARQFADQMAPEEGFRDGHIAVTEALANPARWPEAAKLLDESEARAGRFNFARPLQPGYDPVKTIKGLEDILHGGFGSYWMMIWQPEYVGLRKTPEFQEFLRRNKLIGFWRSNGWPPQCKPDGDGARCD
jgi:tetratricopeptide (TPR) repeat protein